MTLRTRNTPMQVLEAIHAYCSGDGSLYAIGRALELDTTDFIRVLEWYITCEGERHPLSQPEPQELLNIILLQLLNSYRQELITQRTKLLALEQKLRRLQTPYRD